ncbi:junctional adhesion molecule C isoform 2-T2 [Geothlypis trichas]
MPLTGPAPLPSRHVPTARISPSSQPRGSQEWDHYFSLLDGGPTKGTDPSPHSPGVSLPGSPSLPSGGGPTRRNGSSSHYPDIPLPDHLLSPFTGVLLPGPSLLPIHGGPSAGTIPSPHSRGSQCRDHLLSPPPRGSQCQNHPLSPFTGVPLPEPSLFSIHHPSARTIPSPHPGASHCIPWPGPSPLPTRGGPTAGTIPSPHSRGSQCRDHLLSPFTIPLPEPSPLPTRGGPSAGIIPSPTRRARAAPCPWVRCVSPPLPRRAEPSRAEPAPAGAPAEPGPGWRHPRPRAGAARAVRRLGSAPHTPSWRCGGRSCSGSCSCPCSAADSWLWS